MPTRASRTPCVLWGIITLLGHTACGDGASPSDGTGAAGGQSAAGGMDSGAGGLAGGGGTGATSSGGSTSVEVPPYVRRIAAVGSGTCAIEQSGEVVCWSSGDESRPLTGTFVEITAQVPISGGASLCGVRTDGSLQCPGSQAMSNFPTESDFVHVTSLGGGAGCGQRQGGQLVCWGYEEAQAPESGDFDALTSVQIQACGLKLGQPATCWDVVPTNVEGALPTSDRAHMIGAISWCQIVNGLVECRAAPSLGGRNQPEEVHQIATGGEELTCGLTIDGRRICAGSERALVNLPDPSERFVEIAVGHAHACGILASGIVTCWGSVQDDQPATVPREIRVF